MKLQVFLALWASTHAVAFSNNHKVRSSPLEGRKIVPVNWDIVVFPGEEPRTFQGTIEEVYDQVLAINPEFDIKSSTQEDSEGSSAASSLIEARDSTTCYYRSNMPSGWPTSRPQASTVNSGIKHLRGLEGNAWLDPGPGECGRVSCSWGAAIYWCNDNDDGKSLAWEHIANCAKTVCDDCEDSFNLDCAGQRFHQDNWNCIVRSDTC